MRVNAVECNKCNLVVCDIGDAPAEVAAFLGVVEEFGVLFGIDEFAMINVRQWNVECSLRVRALLCGTVTRLNLSRTRVGRLRDLFPIGGGGASMLTSLVLNDCAVEDAHVGAIGDAARRLEVLELAVAARSLRVFDIRRNRFTMRVCRDESPLVIAVRSLPLLRACMIFSTSTDVVADVVAVDVVSDDVVNVVCYYCCCC